MGKLGVVAVQEEIEIERLHKAPLQSSAQSVRGLAAER
jgi:hypothetical protein